MNAKQLKDAIYSAEMSLSEQSRQDKRKVKKHDHSKKHGIPIPELKLLILDDKPERAERLEKIIKDRNNLV